jgi:hypothetical protein
MIHYALQCGEGHEFEGWFRDSADFERQSKRGVVACPACGSTKVEKQMMAPAVSSPKKKESASAGEPEKLQVAAADPRRAELVEALRELRKSVTANADYVGDKFSEEARKIHYKETEPRGIYGEASPDEAQELAEEGIEFHPLPRLPEDRN